MIDVFKPKSPDQKNSLSYLKSAALNSLIFIATVILAATLTIKNASAKDNISDSMYNLAGYFQGFFEFSSNGKQTILDSLGWRDFDSPEYDDYRVSDCTDIVVYDPSQATSTNRFKRFTAWETYANNGKLRLATTLYMGIIAGQAINGLGLFAKEITKTIQNLFSASLIVPAYWNYMLGKVEFPKGLSRVYAKDQKHPDGAQHFDSLEFDKKSPAGQNIIASRRSALAGDALKNGIYYGDAGTGKSSFVRSFAHEKNFEVYSITGENMTVTEFTELYNWLVQNSSDDRRIYVDLSEGDHLLNLITGTASASSWMNDNNFQNIFKSLYDSAQQNFALIISCNYNTNVEKAIDVLLSNEALKRRFPTQIRFEVPNYPIRLKLFKEKAFTVIKETNSFANEEIRQEATDFFTNLLNPSENKEWLRDILVTYTEGLSHNGVNTLATELVYVWIGHNDMLQKGEDPEISEWDTLFDENMETDIADSSSSDYVSVLTDYLKLPSATRDWIKLEKEKLLEQKIEEMDRSIPLLKRQAEIAELQRLIYSGQYDKAQEKAKKELDHKTSDKTVKDTDDKNNGSIDYIDDDSLFMDFIAPAA